MVERPTVFTLTDLKRFPSRSPDLLHRVLRQRRAFGYRDFRRESTPKQVWTG